MSERRRLVFLKLNVVVLLVTFVTNALLSHGTGINFAVKDFGKNATKLLDSLLANYDKRIRPGHGSGPTTIQVNMNVRSMGPFSEKEELYAMQLYLRQSWKDPRLSFDKHILGVKKMTSLSMNWMLANRLWKPDTFFLNGKNSYFHKISAPNMFIRLNFNGVISWSMRLTVRATCKMHLRKFPLDTQQCSLIVASFGYNLTDIRYQWVPNKHVEVSSDVSIAQYELVSIMEANDTVSVRDRERISTLTVKFSLRRQTGYFLLQVYIPCILIVSCSWVAFWITKKDVPGRVCLSVLTVLSMTTLGFGGQTAPPVSYATALDYFMIMCFAFVFAAALEYAFINFFERATIKRMKKMEELKREIVERINKAASGATMVVTTTVQVAEEVPDIATPLHNILRVPLSVVAIEEGELGEIPAPVPGDTTDAVKSLMTLPLTLMPAGSEALTSSDIIRQESISAVSEKVTKAKSLTLRGIRRRMKLASQKNILKKTEDSETAAGTPSASVVVDVSGESPLPLKHVTIWELLMEKQKLMYKMSPQHVIPTEEDILERFIIVDVYSRRMFPSLFFFLLSLYWILFNYYITDEFSDEEVKHVSDGLVIT